MKLLLSIAGLLVAFAAPIAIAADEPGKPFVIALRLPEWKSMHFDDPAKAKEHAAAVRRMGAEVRLDQHNGHIDVTYRTDGWKALRVKTDKLAHSWVDWLKKSGFETLHGHAPDHPGHAYDAGHDHAHEPDEVVLIRTTDWVSQHVHDPRDVDDLVVIAEALRCDVQKANHRDHSDVRIRCPEWTAVEFPSHEVASVWMKWFESRGFQVRHEHGNAASHAGHSH